MRYTPRDTPIKKDLKKDMEPKSPCSPPPENSYRGIDSATPQDWDRLRKQAPAIEPREEKTGLEAWVVTNVSEPSHYIREGGIECIDVMTSLFGEDRVREWAEITAFKYQWRQGTKAGNTAEQDKLKSIWYTRFSMGDDPRND